MGQSFPPRSFSSFSGITGSQPRKSSIQITQGSLKVFVRVSAQGILFAICNKHSFWVMQAIACDDLIRSNTFCIMRCGFRMTPRGQASRPLWWLLRLLTPKPVFPYLVRELRGIFCISSSARSSDGHQLESTKKAGSVYWSEHCGKVGLPFTPVLLWPEFECLRIYKL